MGTAYFVTLKSKLGESLYMIRIVQERIMKDTGMK